MDAPRNCWYVAAHSAELTDKPLPRTIFGHNMVLYRQSSGTPAALIDRCSHRLAPLSLGRVEGDLIRCGYHGALFDANGECKTEVRSGLEASACAVRSFPILELHGFIWVWPGDASIADKGGSIAPFVRMLDDEDAVYSDGSYISFKAPYSLVVDNLMDATHGQYVHETTLGCDGLQSVRDDKEEDFKVDVGPNSIHFEVDLKNGEAGRCFHEGLALLHGMDKYADPVDWRLTADWQAPSFHYFEANTRPAGASDNDWMVMGTVHAITPETQHSCNYFFKQVEIVRPGMKSFNDYWTKATAQAFSEDKVMIEAQYREMGGKKSAIGSKGWTMFMSDDLSMAARGIVAGMIAAEGAQGVA